MMHGRYDTMGTQPIAGCHTVSRESQLVTPPSNHEWKQTADLALIVLEAALTVIPMSLFDE